jgi:hypothetical protein
MRSSSGPLQGWSALPTLVHIFPTCCKVPQVLSRAQDSDKSPGSALHVTLITPLSSFWVPLVFWKTHSFLDMRAWEKFWNTGLFRDKICHKISKWQELQGRGVTSEYPKQGIILGGWGENATNPVSCRALSDAVIRTVGNGQGHRAAVEPRAKLNLEIKIVPAKAKTGVSKAP